jgi:hypothetical protein
MTATIERRQETLQLAREHDFIILEGNFPPHTYITESGFNKILQQMIHTITCTTEQAHARLLTSL